MKIVSIENRNTGIIGAKSIRIYLDNEEVATFTSFGHAIYTSITKKLLKSDFTEFKRDIKKYDWDLDKLRKEWVD